MTTITLYDTEHEELRVDFTIEEARKLSMIKGVISDLGIEEGEIEIQKAHSQRNLDLIMRYVQYDVLNPEEVNDQKLRSKTDVSKPLNEWELEFFDIELSEVFPLMLLANFLEYTRLLKACGEKIAMNIRGKTPEEIRARFGMKDDLTDEQKNELKVRQGWTEK